MNDVVGNEICVGDTVALARRSGNSAEMVIRKVVEVKGKDSRWPVKVEAPSGRCGWANPSNMVVLGL